MIFPAKKNDGVSPVIGTILLVAITVVLVAIISAVVMGMAGSIGTGHVVGVQVAPTDVDGEILIIISGADAGNLAGISAYLDDVPGKYYGSTSIKPIVGTPYNFTFNIVSPPSRFSVVGQFTDGTNQTIFSVNVGE